MHEGHRNRLKDRFLREGLDGFESHNVLELLLFYSIPQRDTNELAHLLINKFGSVSDVFDAPLEALMSVPGIKKHSAVLLKLIPEIARYYYSKAGETHEQFDNVDKIGKMLINKYVGVTDETVYLLLFDNKFKLLDCIKVYEGSVNSVHISPRKMIEPAIIKRASMVVLAHNHPGGVPIPSSEDINTTCVLKNAFDLVGITLLEHILVEQNKYVPLLLRSNGLLRQYPQVSGFYSGITQDFYSEE
ncbi:MAG: RadC family protein [Clostridiales bacterium]|nr:RadC family protein [Clostridiales bacterium]